MAQGASVKGQVWEGGEVQQRGPLCSQVVPMGDSGFRGWVRNAQESGPSREVEIQGHLFLETYWARGAVQLES